MIMFHLKLYPFSGIDTRWYYFLMNGPAAGFVLTGGKSQRMGLDKALLPIGDFTLIEFIAAEMQLVTGQVRLVGKSKCGLEAIDDLYPDQGPLGGIVTALTATTCHWNLIVACDMPGIDRAFLRKLLDEAVRNEANQCVIPVSGGREHPLCAAYSRNSLPVLKKQMEEGQRAVTQAIRSLRATFWQVDDGSPMQNVNTPEDWQESLSRRNVLVR